jgi:long-chain fatty acid transport protein
MKNVNRNQLGSTRSLAPFKTVAAQALLFCLALSIPGSALAVAFRLPNQDPLAIARGNAFVATADNPSAIFYNPAGITQLEGQNVSVGLYLVSAGTSFTSSATGATANTDSSFQPVPQVYYTYTPEGSRFSFGVGVYVPYGLSLDWGENPPFRDVAMRGSLLYATINPVVAYKVLTNLSVAIGPTINYSKAEFVQGISPLTPGDQFKFTGDDFDFGFNAGALYKPFEQWSFGLNYHYQTTMNYKGHSSTDPSPPYPAPADTTAAIRFPQYVVAGVSFRPTEKWNLEVDVDWTDWGNVNQVTFQGTGLGNLTLPLNYHSSLMYEFGVTRYFDNGWYASAGYFYSENSVPNQYFNPIIPDNNLNLWSIGVGHKGEKWGWAFSYTLAYNPGHEVNNSVFDKGPVPGFQVNGNYKTINNALNFAVSYKF